MGKRKRMRRSFTPEFKAEAVKVVRQSEKSVAMVARDLDLTETALRRWVEAAIDAGHGRAGALTTDERAELTQLRREVRTLRMERDILKNSRVTARPYHLLDQKLPERVRSRGPGGSGRLLIGDVANP